MVQISSSSAGPITTPTRAGKKKASPMLCVPTSTKLLIFVGLIALWQTRFLLLSTSYANDWDAEGLSLSNKMFHETSSSAMDEENRRLEELEDVEAADPMAPPPEVSSLAKLQETIDSLISDKEQQSRSIEWLQSQLQNVNKRLHDTVEQEASLSNLPKDIAQIKEQLDGIHLQLDKHDDLIQQSATAIEDLKQQRNLKGNANGNGNAQEPEPAATAGLKGTAAKAKAEPKNENQNNNDVSSKKDDTTDATSNNNDSNKKDKKDDTASSNNNIGSTDVNYGGLNTTANDGTDQTNLTPDERQKILWAATTEEFKRTKAWKNSSTFVTVHRNTYADTAALAQAELESVLQGVDTDCEMYFLAPTEKNNNQHRLRFRCTKDSKDQDHPCDTANLCKVVLNTKYWKAAAAAKTKKEDDTKDKSAILVAVDSLEYLQKSDILEATLNKASYAFQSDRPFYVWIGNTGADVLNKRHPETLGPAFGYKCAEWPLGNSVEHYAPVALLALLEKTAPSTKSVLYLDAGTAFGKKAFEAIAAGVGPETYLEISGQASLVGPQTTGGLLFGSGTTIWRNSRWTRDFLALWWYGRCGPKDELSLWNMLYATWSAWTTLVTGTKSKSKIYKNGKQVTGIDHWAYPPQFFFEYTAAKNKLFMNFREYGHGIQTSWEAVEEQRKASGKATSNADDEGYDYPVPTSTSLLNGGYTAELEKLGTKLHWALELPHVLVLPPDRPVSYVAESGDKKGTRVDLPLLTAARDTGFVDFRPVNICEEGCYPYVPEKKEAAEK